MTDMFTAGRKLSFDELHDDFRETAGHMAALTIIAKIAVMNVLLTMA
jgi:hypothetical protein